MPRRIPRLFKHTQLTDKEVAGAIDHADSSVTDAKMASGVGLSDEQICKLPVAVADKVLKRGAAAWEAGDVPAGLIPWEDYFYWLTLMESLDAFFPNESGTGSVSIASGELSLQTGTTSDSYGWIRKDPDWPALTFTWEKNRKFRTKIRFINVTKQEVYAWIGDVGPPHMNASNHVGFKVIDDVLYGTVGDYVAESVLELGTITATNYLLECVFKAGVECRFYVDGVDKGALTTHLPSGIYGVETIMNVEVRNTEAVNKRIDLSMWEFWQDR